MRALLRADRRALANLCRRREGRRALAANLIGLGGLVLGIGLAGSRVFTATPLRHALRDAPETMGPPLFAVLLALALVFGMAFALADVSQLLFQAPSAELLLVAPVPRRAILLRAWVLAGLRAWLVGAALTLPMLGSIVQRTRAGAGVLPAHVLATGVLTLVAVAIAILLSVLLRRFAMGPRGRVLVNVGVFVLGCGLALLVGAGLFSGKSQGAALAAALPRVGEQNGPLLGLGHWLAAAGGLVTWQWHGEWLLLALPLVPLALALATRLYPAAYERSLIAAAPHARRARRRAPRRRWPAGAVASIAWRDFLIVLRSRGTLAALGVLGTLAVLIQTTDVLRNDKIRHEAAPAVLNQVLALGSVWGLVQAMISTMLGVALLAPNENERVVLALSPLARGRLLLGKLPALALPWAWVLLVFVLAAPWTAGAGPGALLGLLAVVVPWVIATMALVLATAALPSLLGVAAGAGAALRLLLVVTAGAGPSIGGLVVLAWFAREARHRLAAGGDGAAVASLAAQWLAACWAIAIAVTLLGGWAAARGYARLLGPRNA